MEKVQVSSLQSNSKVMALFKDYQSAESAYRFLLDKGYKAEAIHLFMSDQTHKKHFSFLENDGAKLGSKTLEGVGVGAAVGAAIGSIAAAVAAIGTSLVIPALGIVIAGPIVASLAGAGAGSLTGGIVGALVGAGAPDDKSQIYAEAIKAGGIVIGIYPSSLIDAREIVKKWENLQAEDIFVIE